MHSPVDTENSLNLRSIEMLLDVFGDSEPEVIYAGSLDQIKHKKNSPVCSTLCSTLRRTLFI